MAEIHSVRKIEKEIKEFYRGHYFFRWKRPRKVWLEAEVPVFLDFGGPDLLWLQVYDDLGQHAVRRVSKDELVANNGGRFKL